MTDIKHSSLILKTSDFTSNSDYLYGNSYNNGKNSSNAKLSSITWNNINLRVLLGDMYDKYDTFNLCLNAISTSQANSIDPFHDSKNVSIKLSGLAWLNQSYNVKSLTNNNNSTTIGTFNFVGNSATSQFYNSNNIATFSKAQDICNITIEYQRILDEVVVNNNLSGSIITTLTATGNSNSNTLTLSSSDANIFIGTYITANTYIPAQTFITSINGTSITISQNTLQALANQAVTIVPIQTYPNTIFVFDIFGIPKDN